MIFRRHRILASEVKPDYWNIERLFDRTARRDGRHLIMQTLSDVIEVTQTRLPKLLIVYYVMVPVRYDALSAIQLEIREHEYTKRSG